MTRMNSPLQHGKLPAVVWRKAGHTVRYRHSPFPPQWFREDAVCLFLLLLSLAFFSLVVPHATHAETFVSGEVSGVWDTDGSPYLITDTLIVPEGDTLLIEPGVTVEFQDQDSTQLTPFYINGTLLAEGTAVDSITFAGAEFPYYGFILNNATMVLDHCVVTDFSQGFICRFSATTFRNSRLDAETSSFYNSSMGTDVFSSVCVRRNGESFHSSVQVVSSDSLVLNGINAPGGYVALVSCAIDTIRDNILQTIRTTQTDVVVIDNELESAHIEQSTVEFINNVFTASIYGWHANIDVIDNTLFGGIILDENFQATIHDNIFASWPSGIMIWGGGVADIRYNNLNLVQISQHAEVAIVNNTFYFDNHGVEGSDLENVEIINNIFLAMEDTSIAIYSGLGEQPGTIAYNCFYGMDEATNDLDLDEGNLFENPFLAGGDPFDYHLQANSPCIDAGDPDSPDDPDGTEADMGCFFYNQSIDNPPTITIPLIPILQTGSLLSIEITATDDHGPLDYTFPDLPEWLTEEDELDWVSDTTIVSGTIPDSSQDCSFTVIVVDGLGQTDTAVVTIDVDIRTVLQGEISGILHVEDSPFYVVEDIFVPEGDSLVIEPGCELQFRYVEDEEQRIGLDVFGRLIAQGTEEDSIIFTMSEDEAVIGGWQGIIIYNSSDSTRISFVSNSFSMIAITVESSIYIDIENSDFLYFDNFAIRSINSEIRIYNSDFYKLSDYGNCFIRIEENSEAYIDSCTFLTSLEEVNIYPIRIYQSYCEIHNSIFSNTESIKVDIFGCCRIINNLFMNIHGYISIGTQNWSRSVIMNNTIYGDSTCHGRGVRTTSSRDSIINNMFYRLQFGIEAREAQDTTDLCPVIYNNIFYECNIPIINERDSSELTIQYNSFYHNDSSSTNCCLDSTNLFLDPCVADTLFRLYDNSLLIDAGHPATFFNDTDGTRNDIGCWGGPYGESYEYPLWVRDENNDLPTEFKVFPPYPNPFNSTQTISFTIPKKSDVRLCLFNILGQVVVKETLPSLGAGIYHYILAADNISSGVYFLQVTVGKEVKRERVVLLR